MTTLVPFPQGSRKGVAFQAVLDGAAYTLVTTWNVYGERWYATCRDSNGVLVFHMPLIASPAGYDVSLTAGYFATTLVYREASEQFEVGS